MTTADKLWEVLRAILLQLPSLLAMLGCIMAAIVRWKRHPRVSLTVTISMVLFIASTGIFAFVYTFVPDILRKPGGDYRSMQTALAIISFIYNSTWAVALATLLAAIFMQRRSPAVNN
jgi:hypothetical protein